MQNGRSLALIHNIMVWLNENGEQMYKDFMASKPDSKSLLFIHRWYDIDRFKKEEHRLDPKKVNQINLSKFKTALLNYVERKIARHRDSVRAKTVDEINTRLHKCKYIDKLNYLDFQIETTMREMSMYYQKRQYFKELKKIRRQVQKNSYGYLKKKNIMST